jgi:hypothetical protein
MKTHQSSSFSTSGKTWHKERARSLPPNRESPLRAMTARQRQRQWEEWQRSMARQQSRRSIVSLLALLCLCVVCVLLEGQGHATSSDFGVLYPLLQQQQRSLVESTIYYENFTALEIPLLSSLQQNLDARKEEKLLQKSRLDPCNNDADISFNKEQSQQSSKSKQDTSAFLSQESKQNVNANMRSFTKASGPFSNHTRVAVDVNRSMVPTFMIHNNNNNSIVSQR